MKRMLITGGAGFIGCNAAAAFIQEGWEVSILDNLSRKGTELNLSWLEEHYSIRNYQLDFRDFHLLKSLWLRHSHRLFCIWPGR